MPGIAENHEFAGRAFARDRIGWIIDGVTRRVLVVDDHPSFRRLVSRLLTGGGYDVVGEATDGRSACEASARLDPDVVLLDVVLPDEDGFAVSRKLAGLARPPIVVLVSSRRREDFAGMVERSPVRGFLSKSDLTLARLRALVDG